MGENFGEFTGSDCGSKGSVADRLTWGAAPLGDGGVVWLSGAAALWW